jgi:hypothetical protein
VRLVGFTVEIELYLESATAENIRRQVLWTGVEKEDVDTCVRACVDGRSLLCVLLGYCFPTVGVLYSDARNVRCHWTGPLSLAYLATARSSSVDMI